MCCRAALRLVARMSHTLSATAGTPVFIIVRRYPVAPKPSEQAEGVLTDIVRGRTFQSRLDSSKAGCLLCSSSRAACSARDTVRAVSASHGRCVFLRLP